MVDEERREESGEARVEGGGVFGMWSDSERLAIGLAGKSSE